MEPYASSLGISRRGALLGMGVSLCWPTVVCTSSARTLATAAETAFRDLCSANPDALALSRRARAVLVFPTIMKAGALVGGQIGEGAMLSGGRAAGFYAISALSYGLQLGAQRYGYALFFMTEKALERLREDRGWSVGTGLSIAFVGDDLAEPIDPATLSKDVYAVAFSQRGLMVGSGLEGAKIRGIRPAP